MLPVNLIVAALFSLSPHLSIILASVRILYTVSFNLFPHIKLNFTDDLIGNTVFINR